MFGPNPGVIKKDGRFRATAHDEGRTDIVENSAGLFAGKDLQSNHRSFCLCDRRGAVNRAGV